MNDQARWINGWSSRASLTYPEFLQAKEFEKSYRYAIDEQTRALIANENDLAEAHIAVIREQNSLLAEIGTTIATNIAEINGTLNWGFSEVIAGIGRLNDQLSDLVKIARTPAQTWAYEQFDIARDAYRKSLYSESLRYLDRAINGAAGSAGYDLEYRFHFLKGLILLGSYANNDPSVLDLPAAETSFLLAARFSRSDYQEESARSLLLASRAAYCNRKLDHAMRHITECISLAPRPVAEAHFQRAKIFCAMGERLHDAAEDIIVAVRLERVYALKIGSDGDIAPHESLVMARIDKLRSALKAELEVAETAILAALQRRQSICIHGLSYSDPTPLKEVVASFRKKVSAGTYYSLLDAAALLPTLRSAAVSAWQDYTRASLRPLDAEVKSLAAECSVASTKVSAIPFINVGLILILLCLGLVGGCFGLCCSTHWPVSNGVLLIGWGVFVLLCVTPGVCVNPFRRRQIRKRLSQHALLKTKTQAAKEEAERVLTNVEREEGKVFDRSETPPPRQITEDTLSEVQRLARTYHITEETLSEVRRLARTSKVDAIRYLRAANGLGLTEAKDIVVSLGAT